MIEQILNWIPLIVVMGLIIIFFLIARENAILNHYEAGTKYNGFLESVLFHLFQTGGNSFLFMPMLWFDFKDKEEFEIKHLKKRNMFSLIVFGVILFFVIIVIVTKV